MTIKQVEWRDHRPGLATRAGSQPQPPARAHRQEGRRRRLRARPGWPPPSSSPGPGTTSPSSSGPTASAACSATASPSSRWRSADLDRRLDQMRAEGTRFVTGVEVGGSGRRPVDRAAAGRVRRRRARRRRHRRPRPARPGPRARRHPPGDGVPALRQPAVQLGELDDPPINAARQARRDHRRRRHRRRLPRHRAPPGRGVGRPSSRSCRAPPDGRAQDTNPWPTYPMIMPGLAAPTRRAASGCTRSTPSASSATTTATSGRCCCTRSSVVDGRFQKVEGTERELPADLVFLAMGFTGAAARGPARALGVEVDGRGNVARDDRVHVHRARRVRGRRHGPRAVAHRVGDRRGPGRGRRGGHVPDRRLRPAAAGHPDGGRAALGEA